MDFGKFSEYGLIGLIVGALFFIGWRRDVWIMAFVNKITQQHNDERQVWMITIGKQNDLLNKISNSVDEHDRRANERGHYVKEEHNKMIENLEEQHKILLRINGEKH